MDGVIALEQASSPGRVLASPAFAELVGPGSGTSEAGQSSAGHFDLSPSGSLGTVWLDAPFETERPTMATFMRSRPQKASAMIVVADLFADEAAASKRLSQSSVHAGSKRQSQSGVHVGAASWASGRQSYSG